MPPENDMLELKRYTDLFKIHLLTTHIILQIKFPTDDQQF